MDDVPSRDPEKDSSEYVPPANGDESSDAADGEAPGIFNDLLNFGEDFLVITDAVQSVLPRGMNPEDWKEILQKVASKAIEKQKGDPKYFSAGNATHWARHAAKNARLDLERRQRAEAKAEEEYRDYLKTRGVRPRTPAEEYERGEVSRRLAGALEVLTPKKRKAVVAHMAEGLSAAEAGAEYGMSARVVRRAVERFKRYTRIVLADLRPEGSSARRRGPSVAKPSIVRGDHDKRS